MEKYICIHGHFYQPPRENPWLEAVEFQDSANPYHDWNERITAECYGPNGHARLIDGGGKIERIVNNYSKISFNFGPTLLSWIKEKKPDILAAIVEADKCAQKQFSGHGTALAQSYNHMIMPLANKRDKVTQTLWGIADFESKFGRKSEGMWLPETAADDESLEVLAQCGIKFTILSPFQASRVRPLSGGDWQDVNGGRVDPSMPYLVKLPSGKSIVVFYYDGGVAKAVAFERLLGSGDTFAGRIMGAFDDSRGRDQLVNVATDGESYGHHFTYGDMALAYALSSIEKQGKAKLTVYGEYLEKHPPTHETQIHQGSAWSCSHGVGRWKTDCGCNSGGHAGWNQRWREPLRNALDWLRDKLAATFETKALSYLKDPWAARDAYISVILDRGQENLQKFFSEYAKRPLNEEEITVALRLLEIQRHAMLMYTSCGWFFDELSGLETVQVIQYAARAIQLAGIFGEDLEPAFLDRLSKAESNLPDPHDGRQIYERYVKPSIISREFVGAHFAISSLFQSYPEEARIYAFTIKQEDRELFTVGKTKLATGRIKIIFEITRTTDVLTYAVFHTGDHTINCALKEDGDKEGYAKMVEELKEPFNKGDFPEIIRIMDRHFGPAHYSVGHLFRDEQRKVLEQILAAPRNEIYGTLHHITEYYAPLRRFMADLHAPPLQELTVASEIVLNAELQKQFAAETLDVERVRALLAECAAGKVPLDSDKLAYVLKENIERLSQRFLENARDMQCLQEFLNMAEVIKIVPFKINFWKPQNTYYEIFLTAMPEMRRCCAEGNEQSRTWVEKFLLLGDKLGFAPAAQTP
jgi:alpha-amylase/alpha-mannosidase (GH57 family)